MILAQVKRRVNGFFGKNPEIFSEKVELFRLFLAPAGQNMV